MRKLSLLIAFLIPVALFAQNSVKIFKSELAENVDLHQIAGKCNLIAVYGYNSVVLIDAGYGSTGKMLKDTLKTDNVKYIINTHWHSDHTGGNTAFNKDVNIIAHENVYKRVSTIQKLFGKDSKPLPEYAQPDMRIKKKTVIDFYEHKIEIIPLTGGHTDGDVIVYLPNSKVLAVGDLLFAGLYPFVDTENGGNMHKYFKNIEWITKNIPADVKVVGGHGPVFSIQQYKEYLSTLKETVKIVSDLKKDGKTVDEIIESKCLKEYADYGKFFITEPYWIETIYKAL